MAEQVTLFGRVEGPERRRIAPAWNNEETKRWSLVDARAHVERIADDGGNCPCCGQRVQVYRRTINAGMARALIAMWAEVRRQCGIIDPSIEQLASTWIDVRTINVRGGDYAKLAYWGIIESTEVDGAHEKRSGWWRVTPTGAAFVLGRVRVPSAVYVYDGRVLDERDVDSVSINDVVASRFSIDELLGGKS